MSASDDLNENELNDRFDRLEELAAVAAQVLKEEAIHAARHLEEHVATEIHRQDETLLALQKAVAEVNKSVSSLLSSVLVLQRNSMRVLGGAALLAGVLISVLSRAAGL